MSTFPFESKSPCTIKLYCFPVEIFSISPVAIIEFSDKIVSPLCMLAFSSRFGSSLKFIISVFAYIFYIYVSSNLYLS